MSTTYLPDDWIGIPLEHAGHPNDFLHQVNGAWHLCPIEDVATDLQLSTWRELHPEDIVDFTRFDDSGNAADAGRWRFAIVDDNGTPTGRFIQVEDGNVPD
jgi:hypothetical protein